MATSCNLLLFRSMLRPLLMRCNHCKTRLNFSFTLISVISVLISTCACSINEWQSSPCPHSDMCKSQWDFCGYGPTYCGDGCQAGPCLKTTSAMIVTPKIFQCIFNALDNRTRIQRLNSLRRSGWRPMNRDEAAIFLAHVYHETDGLQTLTEYCGPSTSPYVSVSISERNATVRCRLPFELQRIVVRRSCDSRQIVPRTWLVSDLLSVQLQFCRQSTWLRSTPKS